MTGDLFKILYSGELQGDIRAEDAIRSLSATFKLSETKARILILGGSRHVLKRNLDRETAERYRVELERIGLIAHIEPMNPRPEGLALAPLGDTSSEAFTSEIPVTREPDLSCPACGSRRLENGTCQDCGVVRDKYLARHGKRGIESRFDYSATAAASNPNPQAPPRAVPRGQAREGRPGGPWRMPAGHGLTWIRGGFQHFKANPWAWMLAMVVFAVVSFLVGLTPKIGWIVATLLGPILTGGLMLGAREQALGRDFRLEHLFAGFSRNAGQLALVGLLYLVGLLAAMLVTGIVMAAALIPVMGGIDPQLLPTEDPAALWGVVGPVIPIAFPVAFLLFIPPLMAILFAPALVILDGLPATAAMKLSFAGCLKNMLPLLVYGLFGLVLFAVGAIPLGLGLLVVWPTLTAASYVAYRDIFFGGGAAG